MQAKYVICEYYFGNGKKEFVQIISYAENEVEAQEAVKLGQRFRNGQPNYGILIEENEISEPMWSGGWTTK